MAEEESTGGTTIINRMQQKAGPLPVWAWIVVVAGVGYLYYKHKQNLAAAAATTPTGPVTVQNGGSGLVSDTGTQEQLNDINAGISSADTQLANIGTNVGTTAGTVKQIAGVVTRPANLDNPSDIQHYYIIHNTKNGLYYYVNTANPTSFLMSTPTAQSWIRKYHPSVKPLDKIPYYDNGALKFRPTPVTAKKK